jgi:hypothetical protein
MNQDRFQEMIQSCHLNFLIGSGCSMPFLKTLSNVESLLTEIDKNESLDAETRKLIKASVLKQYFDHSIENNLRLLKTGRDESCLKTLNGYKNFIKDLSEIVLQRKSSILNKQVNIFTSNIDIFLEQSIEELRLELNDGFSGRLDPVFNLSNFRKAIFKTSSHYDNVSELPVFNLYKVHGSVTWKMNEQGLILLDPDLSLLKAAKEHQFNANEIMDIIDSDTSKPKTLQDLIDETFLYDFSTNHDTFLNLYDQLAIVNPTKEKFRNTTLHYTYYEQLRMFSNELEKENVVLFVMGFSFSDEHIREIVLRSLNSNPTLVVAIFAYEAISEGHITQNLKLQGHPPKYNNLIFMPRIKEGEAEEEKEHDLHNINKYYFNTLCEKINDKEIVNA